MRIEVSALLANERGPGIEFRAPSGVGAGKLMSETPAKVGETYDVEVGIDEAASDVRMSAGGTAGLRLDGDRVVLGGILRVFPDGAAYLEVGPSGASVDLPEEVGLPARPGEVVEVSTEWGSVLLYPYDL